MGHYFYLMSTDYKGIATVESSGERDPRWDGDLFKFGECNDLEQRMSDYVKKIPWISMTLEKTIEFELKESAEIMQIWFRRHYIDGSMMIYDCNSYNNGGRLTPKLDWFIASESKYQNIIEWFDFFNDPNELNDNESMTLKEDFEYFRLATKHELSNRTPGIKGHSNMIFDVLMREGRLMEFQIIPKAN